MAQIIERGRNKWLVRIFVGRNSEGKRQFRNETVEGTKKEVQAWAAEHSPRRVGTQNLRLTVGSLLDSLVSDYRINGRRLDWCEMIVRVHLRPAFGKMVASKLTTDDARKYIEKGQADGLANATINRHLALLRRAFNLGAKDDPPKVARIPFIPTLKENNTRQGFFEDPEYTAMLGALPDDRKPVLTFGYYTGCRRGEILSLQWPQIDLENRTVRLEPGTTKNKQARVIPLELTPHLYESLKMQKTIRDARHPHCPWVFFYYDTGKRIRDLRGAWEEASRAAGLWVGDGKSGKPMKLFHDLRRSGVRNLIRAGVPENVAMRISGHKTRAVFDRYNIVSEADLKDAARRVTRYFAVL